MYRVEGGTLIERGKLAPGHRGTAQTLAMMRQLARRSASNVTVRRAAQAAIAEARVRGHDFLGELRAVHRFVANRIRYVRDPVGTEWIQAPQITLRDGGDCDDKATLLAGMLLSIGHPAQIAFRAIGTNPLSGQYGHVYVVTRLGKHRIPLDPTRAHTPAGWEYPRPTVAGEVRL